MITPFPAAKPSAFITTGKLMVFKYSIAGVWSLNVLYSAVGMLFLFKNSFVKVLDPSS